jgi:hypothetical protein
MNATKKSIITHYVSVRELRRHAVKMMTANGYRTDSDAIALSLTMTKDELIDFVSEL